MSIRVKIAFELPFYIERILLWPLRLYHSIRLGCDVRIIALTKFRFTIVDPQNYDWLNKFKWCLAKGDDSFYAVRNVRIGRGRTKAVFMHRLIMNPPSHLLVDHANTDGLDNRRSTLRIATPSENMFNRRKTKKKTYSRYIGVSFDKQVGKWTATICTNRKSIRLGRFSSEIDAARAYDMAAKQYHKEFARLNFPERSEGLGVVS